MGHCTPASTLTRSRRNRFSACPPPLATVTARPHLAPGSKGALGRSPRHALPSWPSAQHGAGRRGPPANLAGAPPNRQR